MWMDCETAACKVCMARRLTPPARQQYVACSARVASMDMMRTQFCQKRKSHPKIPPKIKETTHLNMLFLRVARLQNEVGTIVFEARIFSQKMPRNFPDIFEPLFCWSEKIPQKSAPNFRRGVGNSGEGKTYHKTPCQKQFCTPPTYDVHIPPHLFTQCHFP